MSDTIQNGPATSAMVHRREFLCLAPSAALASSMPFGMASAPPSRNPVSITEALAALWDHPEDEFRSVIKASTAARLDTRASGCNVGLICASRSDLTSEENQRRCVGLWSDIWPRFGSIGVDVRFTENHDPLPTQTLTERGYLLLGKNGFDSGNLKGFLRQYGAFYDQRLVVYKPFDDRCAYLLGTQDRLVPRRKQIVCVGEFKAARLPDYFRLIREHGSQIEVESMRFPIRKTFFNRWGGEY